MKLTASDRNRIQESAERAAERHAPEKIVTAVCKNTGMSAAAVREVLGSSVPEKGTVTATKSSAPPRKRGRGMGAVSVDALIESERLDAFVIAERALREELGEDETIQDEDLRRHCQISKEDWKDLRDDARLSAWRVRIRRTRRVIWCGRKAKSRLTGLDSIMAE